MLMGALARATVGLFLSGVLYSVLQEKYEVGDRKV